MAHHIVIYNPHRYVEEVVYNAKDIKIDMENLAITFDGGEIIGLGRRNFIIVDHDVFVERGMFLTQEKLDQDETEKFEGFSLHEWKHKLEDFGDDVKEKIQDIIGKDDKK